MAKKTNKILVGLKCTVSNVVNYVTKINKQTVKKLELKKYSPQEGKHTLHVMTKKLD